MPAGQQVRCARSATRTLVASPPQRDGDSSRDLAVGPRIMLCDRAVNGCHCRVRDTRGTMLRCAAVFGAGRLQRCHSLRRANEPRLTRAQRRPRPARARRVSAGRESAAEGNATSLFPQAKRCRRTMQVGERLRLDAVHFPWLEKRPNTGIPCVHSVDHGGRRRRRGRNGGRGRRLSLSGRRSRVPFHHRLGRLDVLLLTLWGLVLSRLRPDCRGVSE